MIVRQASESARERPAVAPHYSTYFKSRRRGHSAHNNSLDNINIDTSLETRSLIDMKTSK